MNPFRFAVFLSVPVAVVACDEKKPAPAAPSAAISASATTSAPELSPPSPKAATALIDTKSTANWTHPGMKLSFTYHDKFLTPAQKPDGATLTSATLGTLEDRSGKDGGGAAGMTVTISVRVGKLMEVWKSSNGHMLTTVFPSGKEDSFKADPGFASKQKVAGVDGYRVNEGSHDAHREVLYAQLKPGSTLELECKYVGDMAKPKVSMADQKSACEKIISTLAITNLP